MTTVPARESDLFRSVRLEPRRILFLGTVVWGGRSTVAAVVAILAALSPRSDFPTLANEDESDLDMVRRVPPIIGNTAVNLILLFDRKPPPPAPVGSMAIPGDRQRSQRRAGRRRIHGGGTEGANGARGEIQENAKFISPAMSFTRCRV